jgi:3',5'-nucleoside bisphosphate phosphatase
VTPFVDLHLHTNASDGTDPPGEVVRRAAELGLVAMALTDHDTVAGLAEGAAAAEVAGIPLVPGVEISALLGWAEIHITGLGIDPLHPALAAFLEAQRAARTGRARTIVDRLHRVGIEISWEALTANSTPGDSLGRMHLAREISRLGHAKTVQQAFDKYLNRRGAAWVGKELPGCGETISVIHDAGGLAFLAHPGIGHASKLLDKLLVLPFDGIEAWHSKHTAGHVDQFRQLAGERGLLLAGGSDCHGMAKGRQDMGSVQVPVSCHERLMEALAERHGKGGH